MATFNTKRLIFPNMEENPMDKLSKSGSIFNGVERSGIDSVVDPLVTGYFFIKWLRLPSWFEKNPDLKNFATLTETLPKSFTGISDIDVQTADRSTGFANKQISTITGIQSGNTDFSIDYDEYSGSPYRNMIWEWINNVRDERTGLARYPEKYNVEYGSRNHTADLLYVVVRPDADNIGNKNRIEYAALYTNVFPTNVPDSSLYSSTLGSNDTPRITLNFKGFCERGPAITEYAYNVLDEQIVNRDSDSSGKIFLDAFQDNEDVLDNINDGLLKDPIASYKSNE